MKAKRVLSLAVALCLVLGLTVPAQAAGDNPFTDVAPGDYFYDAVLWARDTGVTTGTTATTFSPDETCTRAQVVTFLWRAMGEPAPKSTDNPFTDVKPGDYFYAPVLWAVEQGITTGTTTTTFSPFETCTSGQVVTFLWRAMGKPAADAIGTVAEGYEDSAYFKPPVAWADRGGLFALSGKVFTPNAASPRSDIVTYLYLTLGGTPVLTEQEDMALKAALQADIDAILNTETEIVHSDKYVPGKTYTGTAYYVSNDGNDRNDGRTPETAWRTLDRVLDAGGHYGRTELQPGDAVFFRRGDIFRLNETQDGSFDIRISNLTLSAYGDGEKPIITGSSENGAGSEKWKLVYEDAAGKKIWQFYRDMIDVSMLVLNDGEAFTTRVYEYYTKDGYRSCEMYDWWMHTEDCLEVKDVLLPLNESMTEDLSIISRPERSDFQMGHSGVGPLYLRCDGGNPGEIYSSIEFSEFYVRGLVWLQASGVVFDNLSFRCGGNSFIKASNVSGLSWKELTDTRIQNCEFAYGGGCVAWYRTLSGGKPFMEPQGDGIYNVVRNTLIQNNYFHDMMSSTVTYEGSDFNDTDAVDGSFHFLDNVCVNTNGIRLDSTAVALQHLDSVKVCGNQVWNTGHMDNGKFVYSEGSLAMLTPNHYGECIIEDNVFYGTRENFEMNTLLDLPAYDYTNEGYAQFTKPQLRNNTYVQYSGRDFAIFLYHNWEKWSMDDPELAARVARWLDDTTSKFYRIPQR